MSYSRSIWKSSRSISRCIGFCKRSQSNAGSSSVDNICQQISWISEWRLAIIFAYKTHVYSGAVHRGGARSSPNVGVVPGVPRHRGGAWSSQTQGWCQEFPRCRGGAWSSPDIGVVPGIPDTGVVPGLIDLIPISKVTKLYLYNNLCIMFADYVFLSFCTTGQGPIW